MHHNMLGKTGLKVSLMGIGAIPLQRFDKENALAILEKAATLGVNFIDTARGYSVSEEFLGFALERMGHGKFVVATKSMKRDYEGMRFDIETSLKTLKTSYIDLYQCHFVVTKYELDEILSSDGAMKALLEAKKKGLIGHIGVTSHNKAIALSAIDTHAFETVQFPFNFIETDGVDVFKRAKGQDMGTIVMKPIGGGAIKNIDLSLRYIASHGFVDTLIPGVDNALQLTKNAMSFNEDVLALTESEQIIAAKEKAELGNSFCRRCDYCKPCPAGIEISLIMNADAYYRRYSLVDWAKAKYTAIEHNITDCLDCGACEDRCPYGLSIRQMLRDAHEILKNH